MKDEELFKAWKSEQYKDQSTEEKMEFVEHLHTFPKYFEKTFLAGLKAGRPQWHKITDWKDNSQFPNDELKTYLVCLYQDQYVICEMEITEGYRQFYLQDNLDAIDPQDVIAWCEIPTFDKE